MALSIKEIGHYLTTIGANTIAPLVIARTVGGAKGVEARLEQPETYRFSEKTS